MHNWVEGFTAAVATLSLFLPIPPVTVTESVGYRAVFIAQNRIFNENSTTANVRVNLTLVKNGEWEKVDRMKAITDDENPFSMIWTSSSLGRIEF